jgi:hypothetical protein
LINARQNFFKPVRPFLNASRLAFSYFWLGGRTREKQIGAIEAATFIAHMASILQNVDGK